MCELCVHKSASLNAPLSPARRTAIGMLGAMSLFGLSGLMPAAQAKLPPKPANTLLPDQALERLMRGNERYVSGQTQSRNFAETREALVTGQNPYAGILSCADSRVSPELCFDEGRGDFFVTRIAGNYVTNDILSSLEYGVAVLSMPLIMVLGHTNCGAINAAVNAFEKQQDFPGHIQNIVTALMPAVRSVGDNNQLAELRQAAVIENVRHNVRQLQGATPVLSQAVKEGRLKIVGGVYQLATGRVEMV